VLPSAHYLRRVSPNDFFRGEDSIFAVRSKGAGPAGKLPLTEEQLRGAPSGDLFGLTQNAGMGWNPDELNRDQFLILSTLGGLRAPDGKPIALGYHTGHWELGLQVKSAAGMPDVYYTHIKMTVNRGQPIKVGDLIGHIVGHDTNPKMPPHVHIGLDQKRHIKEFVAEDGTLLAPAVA
jgi:hypothetical protein